MPEKKQYCVGFAYSPQNKTIVLIEKQRPDWQKGKLNGVGGKIEPNETPLKAMIREFKEETGVLISYWEHYVTMEFPLAIVYVFRVNADILDIDLEDCHTTTDEKIKLLDSSTIHNNSMIPNLHWLIPMAWTEIASQPIRVEFQSHE